ncbi:hypothetical protein EUGRSUZ_H00898 [Eucalyptus grandis]|uniref:Uncharacterized protein n=2 Tax=Eucalyptus grandis TaxID=71139 RepID=A0ACC3JN65_EUCGR|nr:hypothetical protein EUGRSUZ_H00898 [Eucalyptus grandis]
MATSQRIVALTFVLLWIGNVASGDPDTSETFLACNLATYQLNDHFSFSLMTLLSHLEQGTPYQPNYDYYTTSLYQEAVAYGHATCNPALSYDDCSTCLNYAHGHVLDECYLSIGARLDLQDCKVRYEQYSFTD